MEFVENQWISLKIKHFDGFWRFHEIHEISKCGHDGYTHLELHGDVFTLENARFRGVWKSSNKKNHGFHHYLVGSVSSRSPDVVMFSKMIKLGENQGFWRILNGELSDTTYTPDGELSD